jgi:hypothetical protein
MTSVRKMLAVATALAMVSTPVMASASSASKLSVAQVSKARAGTNTKKGSNIAGASTGLLVLGALAAIGLIVVVADGGKSKSP